MVLKLLTVACLQVCLLVPCPLLSTFEHSATSAELTSREPNNNSASSGAVLIEAISHREQLIYVLLRQALQCH